MPGVSKAGATHAGGAGATSIHNTRAVEMVPLREREHERERDESRDGHDGTRFWTANMPESVLAPDPAADALAAKVFDWEADQLRAEERLAAAVKKGYVKKLDGRPIELRSREELALARLAPPARPFNSLSPLEQRIIRYRAYANLRDAEESARARRGGGLTVVGYQIVISYEKPVPVGVIREVTDRVFSEPFEFKRRGVWERADNPFKDRPRANSAHLVGTDHCHSHTEIQAYDPGGGRLTIHPTLWTRIDEHVILQQARVLGDLKIYDEHMALKEETRRWKRDARELRLLGLPAVDKPHRAADERDQEALRLGSQIKTDLRTLGHDPAEFHVEVRLTGLRSREEVRRLRARSDVAEARRDHALVSGEFGAKTREAAEEAGRLRATFEAALRRRAEADAKKQAAPEPIQFYRTDRQTAEIEALTADCRKLAADDRHVGAMVARGRLAEAAVKEARRSGEVDKLREAEFELGTSRLALERVRELRAEAGKGMPAPTYTAGMRPEVERLAQSQPEFLLALHELDRSGKLAPERAHATAGREFALELLALGRVLEAEGSLREALTGGGRAASGRQDELHLARDFYAARRNITADCLKAAGLSRDEVTPSFAAAEYRGLRGLAAKVQDERAGAEIAPALGRFERALEEPYARDIGEERTLTLELRALALEIKDYTLGATYDVRREMPPLSPERFLSLAQMRGRMAASPDTAPLFAPSARAAEAEIAGGRRPLDTRAAEKEADLGALRVRLRESAAALRECGVVPPPGFLTPEQFTRGEAAAAVLADPELTRRLSELEFSADPVRGAARAQARYVAAKVLALSGVFERREQALPRDHHLLHPAVGEQTRAYKVYLRERGERAASYAEALGGIAERRREQLLGLRGSSARTLFTVGELEIIKTNGAPLGPEWQKWLRSETGEAAVEVAGKPLPARPRLRELDAPWHSRLGESHGRHEGESPSLETGPAFRPSPDDPAHRIGRLLGERLVAMADARASGQEKYYTGTSEPPSPQALHAQAQSLLREWGARLHEHPRAILTPDERDYLQSQRQGGAALPQNDPFLHALVIGEVNLVFEPEIDLDYSKERNPDKGGPVRGGGGDRLQR